ncbi:MAG: hypothetical protein J0L62_13720 [Bacteroidetes bacterium]|nr:hypothetical protein [Bacteroidota bacterium]
MNPSPQNDIEISLKKLQAKVVELCEFFGQDYDFETMIYEFWNAKQVLAHLVFWHESFARNISDIGNEKKPSPLKGSLSEVNQRSVSSSIHFSIPELIQKLSAAQQTIEQHIFNENISMIPYKKGSRPYSRKEHLEVVSDHLNKHLKELRNRMKKGLVNL